MTFKDFLTEWNGGEKRKAASRFSKQFKCAPSAVSNYVRGKMPDPDVLAKMCVFFGKPLDEIRALFDAPPPELKGDDLMLAMAKSLREANERLDFLEDYLEARDGKMFRAMRLGHKKTGGGIIG